MKHNRRYADIKRFGLASMLLILPVINLGCWEARPGELCENGMNAGDCASADANPFSPLDSENKQEVKSGDDPALPFPYTRTSENYFTVIMLPDTQVYVRNELEYFEAQIDWIIENQEALNVQMVAHVGDVVYDYDKDEDQWDRAAQTLERLDEYDIPFLISPGNHDYKRDERDSTMFNDWFPLSRFENMETYQGAFETDKSDSTYHVVESGSFPLLILALEYAPRDEVLQWANDVVDEYDQHHVIVVTHGYLYHDNSLIDEDNSKRAETRFPYDSNINEGDDIWEKLIRENENIFMVLCGHTGSSSDPVGNRVSKNDYGNNVYQQMLNYQRFTMTDNGYLKVLQFFPDDDLIIVSSWSPWFDQFDPRDDAQFLIIDDELFEQK